MSTDETTDAKASDSKADSRPPARRALGRGLGALARDMAPRGAQDLLDPVRRVPARARLGRAPGVPERGGGRVVDRVAAQDEEDATGEDVDAVRSRGVVVGAVVGSLDEEALGTDGGDHVVQGGAELTENLLRVRVGLAHLSLHVRVIADLAAVIERGSPDRVTVEELELDSIASLGWPGSQGDHHAAALSAAADQLRRQPVPERVRRDHALDAEHRADLRDPHPRGPS